MNPRFLSLSVISSLVVGLSLAGCGTPSELPVIQPEPQPPQGTAQEPRMAPLPVPSQIGKFPEVPLPRYGLAIFAYPRDPATSVADYSPEWTGQLVNRLDLNGVPVNTVLLKEPLGKEIDQATAQLARTAEAKVADVFLTGTVSPGGNTQVRLFAYDTKKERLIDKCAFEGTNPNAVTGGALEDILAKVRRYWVELDRGENSELPLEVKGIKDPNDIPRLMEALAAAPGTCVVRHEATSVEAGAARVLLKAYVRGDAGAFQEQLSKLTWKSGQRTAKLRQIDPSHFEVAYE